MDRSRTPDQVPPAASTGGVRVTLGRNLLAIATWALAIGVVIQVFLAGLGVFRDPADFELHRNVGYLLGVVALLLAILAFVVRANRLQRGLGILLVVLFVLQSVFIALRESAPEVAALHVVNGMAIVLVTALFAMRTWRLGGLTDR
ncbi:MAG: hypothetical protein FJ038_08220 [Chloroflexi bacterium]|nr:hypothetical protein [Chloroflexota bacterium]